MKYFAAVLLALAVQVKVSRAECKPIVTNYQNFTTVCEQFRKEQTVLLPYPTANKCYISCQNHNDWTVCSCVDICFNVATEKCVKPSDVNYQCIDSKKICGEGDTRVPYAQRDNRFASKYFADCQSSSGRLEVGICYSEIDEKCLFDSTKGECVVDNSQ